MNNIEILKKLYNEYTKKFIPKILNIKDDNSCLKIFKSNNMLGLIIFINLLIGKLI